MIAPNSYDSLLNNEADAFDKRIEERVNAGFIPDLRRAQKCDYFYKSFWREPHYISLYLGKIVETFLELISIHKKQQKIQILDVGCGAGYISLELARYGHDVVGIDISKGCIDIAKKTLADNPYQTNFGSLLYKNTTIQEIDSTYDCILFSGVLHHMDGLKDTLQKSISLLSSDGIILCYEPCHEQWRKQDAAQVALIRSILSISELWYDDTIIPMDANQDSFNILVEDIYTEYTTERDKHEVGGQSPLDNISSGKEILETLRNSFIEEECRPGFSFIYRLLGGMRGQDNVNERLADLFSLYDSYCVNNKYMMPNGFFFVGRKR